MRSLNSGARKKPWRVGSSQPGKYRTHSRSCFPFLSFSLCCGSFFEDRSVRNGCCWVWLQRTTSRTSSCHQDVAWCSRGWCWTSRELSERSELCKAPNETKKRLKRERGKRWQLKPALSWQHVQVHLRPNFELLCNSKLFQSRWSCLHRRLRCSVDLAARGAAPFVLMKLNQWRQRLNFTVPSCIL